MFSDFAYCQIGEILQICCSNDGKWLFVSDNLGNVKQWSIKQQEMVKDYGNIHKGRKVQAVICTLDSKYVFSADDSGNIKQIDLQRKCIIKDYLQIHQDDIRSLTVSDQFLFSADYSGCVKQFKITNTFLNIAGVASTFLSVLKAPGAKDHDDNSLKRSSEVHNISNSQLLPKPTVSSRQIVNENIQKIEQSRASHRQLLGTGSQDANMKEATTKTETRVSSFGRGSQ